jgi:magnesium transporter
MSSLSSVSAPVDGVAPDEPESIIRVVYRDGTGSIHTNWPASRVDECLRDHAGIVWVDIEGPDEHVTRRVEDWLRDVFQFHPLAIEDALRECHIPKIDDWDDYLYVVFHMANIEPESDVLELLELDVFLGANYLVTYHSKPLSILDQDRLNIERDPRDRLRNGPDHLLVRFLELAIDQSLASIQQLDDRVDAIQDAVIANASPKNLQSIFRLKRSAIELHKNLGPQREVLTKLARDPYKAIQPKHRVYFRDLYDHVVRIHDISEGLRDLIAGVLDTYLSVVSNRTNDIMKTLTIVTVMFLPMSFLTSFFGMNFFGEALALQGPMPRALLFWGTCGIMAVSPCFIWIYARRRKWF